MIEFKNVKKEYQLEDQIVHALAGISATIKDGEFVVILGPSGSGKSTLLHLLCGMDKPTSGKICIGGQDLSEMKSNQLSAYRRQNVGMVFQQYQLINTMSVHDNIALPLKLAGVSDSEADTAVADVVKMVGLTSRMKSTPAKLSGGQQQRVAIARALITNPSIIACDEPTGNLDTKTGDEIMEIIERLHQHGKTIIMVTHNDRYSKYADRVITMLDGAVVKNQEIQSLPERKSDSSGHTGTLSMLSNITMALKNLRRRKLRFFLTSFGIAIGAMAIVILVAFAASLQKSTTDQLGTFIQAEEITVSGDASTGQVSFQMGPSYVKKDVKPLNDATIEELRGIDHVAAVYPKISLSGEIAVDGKSAIFFSTAQPPTAYASSSPKDQVKFGRFLEKDDEQSVVIPAAMATALGFTDISQAVGKQAVLKNFTLGGFEGPNGQTQREVTQKDYTVAIVGVFAADTTSFQAQDAAVPNGTAITMLKALYSTEVSKAIPSLYDSITVRADGSGTVSSVQDAIKAKGYGAETLGDIVKSIAKVYAIMQAVLGVLGGIALLVASLGVANTMFMAVLERTKEIGILKALGARDWDVRKLFTYEAAVIGFFGGSVGLLFGYVGTIIIGTIVSYYTEKNGGGNFVTVGVPWWLASGAVIFSILFASLAGFFPARRAARLDPVVALREE